MSGQKKRQRRDAGAPNARAIAARVIERVERDRAFAAAALDAELQRHPQLDARERALATELCYGTLRMRGALRAELGQFAPKGLPKDQAVVSQLLVAAYQLLVLDRVPAHAAVDAAVEAVTALRGKRVAGFVNAVLRKLASSGRRLSAESAADGSVPDWLQARLTAAVGPEQARALVQGAAPVNVRLVEGAPVPDWLAQAKPGRASPLARVLSKAGDLRELPGFSEGAFVVQEEGAQVVALALGARPGERVLDACAGRGQKSSLLSARVGPSGQLWATDLYPKKLEALATELERLGLPPAHIQALDWTVGSGAVPGGLDRVLVDAPCSGVGTLRRRPEIATRLEPGDPERLGELATVILRRAAEHARPGGRVVFAVCSVLPEEAEQVVARVSDLLEPAPFDAPELGELLGAEQTHCRLLPGTHGTDGYFLASFVRR